MDKNTILEILKKVESGELRADEAYLRLKSAPFEDLGFAKPDHHRALRQGIPEVIYGAGKSAEQIKDITLSLLNGGQKRVLITKLSPEKAESLSQCIALNYNKEACAGLAGDMPEPDGRGYILIITGGTSDIPVAEEAAFTAEALGNRVERLYDVGISGLHRLLSYIDLIGGAEAIISIAGMEGALTSVVGGLADCPVIGVPTSVGYGAAFDGLCALLSMLNSCASGISVVNIDNGFGAAYVASMINHGGLR